MKYVISKEESERINILKLLAMILVVYIHAQNIGNSGSDITGKLPQWLYIFEDVISKDIAGMADALFFLLSAILFFRSERKYTDMLKQKARTLLLPYMIWNSIWVVIFAICEQIPFAARYFTNPEYRVSTWRLADYLKYYGISWSGYPLLYPLWFMRDIMAVMLISPLIRILVKRIPKVIIGIALVVLFLPVSFPFKGAFLFFVIGAAIVELDWHMDKLDRVPDLLVWMIYIVLIVGKEVSANDVIAGLVNIWGIVVFIKLSQHIYKAPAYSGGKMLQKLTGYSFAIYVGHEMFLTIFKKMSAALIPQTVGCVLAEYLFFPVLLMAVCVGVAKMIKHIFPRLYKILNGSR